MSLPIYSMSTSHGRAIDNEELHYSHEGMNILNPKEEKKIHGRVSSTTSELSLDDIPPLQHITSGPTRQSPTRFPRQTCSHLRLCQITIQSVFLSPSNCIISARCGRRFGRGIPMGSSGPTFGREASPAWDAILGHRM